MEYLDYDVKTDRALNVNMMYHTTKRAETMPKYVDIIHGDLCGEDVTHVVTSITWGLNAFLVFEYQLAEHESTENIYGELKLTVSAIPGLSVSGSGSVNLTESQKNLMNRTSIEVYGMGDNTLITDFDEACKAYQELPTLSANPGEQKVIEVRLTPITDICTEAEYLLHELSASTNTLALDVLSNLEKLSIKAKGLLTNRKPTDPNGVGHFNPMVHNLETYIKALEKYIRNFKSDVKKAVQDIRSNENDGEEELLNLLQEHQNSVFEFDKSNQYLIHRNREIKSVVYLLDAFPKNDKNIIVADFESASDIDMELTYENIVHLKLQIITPESVPNNFINGTPTNESKFWYNDFIENGRIGSLIKNFKNFAWENDGSEGKYGFMLELLELDESNPQIDQLYAYNQDLDIYDDFIIPTAPEMPEVQNIGQNSFDVQVKKLNKWTENVKICVTKAFDEEEPNCDDHIFTEDEMFTISGLDAVTLYYITVKYKTDFGYGPPSLPSSKFMTGPSSEPENLRVTHATHDSLQVEWEKPQHMGVVNGELVPAEDLTYRITVSGEAGYRVTQVIDNGTTAFFGGLQDASIYDIEAVAFLIGFHPHPSDRYSGYDETTTVPPTIPPKPLDMLSESQPAIITTHSNILPPTLLPPKPGQVSEHDIGVRWAQPTISEDTDPASISYNLIYNDININVTGTEFQASDLQMGEEYAFKVMIVADTGLSDYSDELVIKTLSNKTDLDVFVDDVQEKLDHLEEEAARKTAFCASKKDWTNTGDITYDEVFLKNNTIDNADMDKESGKFRAGAKGSYMISASLEMMLRPGQEHKIWIQHNNDNVNDTLISSKTNKYSYQSNDNGSKDIVLALEENDEVSLFHETNEDQDGLSNVIFCVRSVKVVPPAAQHN
jgi:hypothetical protein